MDQFPDQPSVVSLSLTWVPETFKQYRRLIDEQAVELARLKDLLLLIDDLLEDLDEKAQKRTADIT